MLQQTNDLQSISNSAVDIRDVSTVLYGAFAFLRERTQKVHDSVPAHVRNRRTSPSGGGLNASEAYVIFQNVKDSAPGLYYYDPASHELHRLSFKPSTDWLPFALNGQYFSQDLGFGVFLTARLDRMWWKYPHSRAYRVCLMDLGHLSQTFLLCATACGLHTWLSGAFSDGEIRERLAIDGDAEHPFLFVGAGHGTGDELDVERKAQLLRKTKRSEQT